MCIVLFCRVSLLLIIPQFSFAIKYCQSCTGWLRAYHIMIAIKRNLDWSISFLIWFPKKKWLFFFRVCLDCNDSFILFGESKSYWTSDKIVVFFYNLKWNALSFEWNSSVYSRIQFILNYNDCNNWPEKNEAFLTQ